MFVNFISSSVLFISHSVFMKVSRDDGDHVLFTNTSYYVRFKLNWPFITKIVSKYSICTDYLFIAPCSSSGRALQYKKFMSEIPPFKLTEFSSRNLALKILNHT